VAGQQLAHDAVALMGPIGRVVDMRAAAPDGTHAVRGLLLSVGDVPELEAGVAELDDIDHLFSGRTDFQPQRDRDVALLRARDPIEATTREPYAYAGNAPIDDLGRSVVPEPPQDSGRFNSFRAGSVCRLDVWSQAVGVAGPTSPVPVR